jgi:hypothetical protein
MNLLACDEYGKLYSIAPDGSYGAIDWEDRWPTDGRVIRGLKHWMVITVHGEQLALFKTRSDARNFLRYLKRPAR